MSLVLLILLGLIVFGTFYQLFACYAVWKFFQPHSSSAPSNFHPPVSILKPMKGMDFELERNITSFCNQDYADYEVRLGFSESDDPAIPFVKKLISGSHCDIELVVNPLDLGPNKKVSNLQGLIESAKYGLVVMSDSDIRVDRDYLNNIVSEFAGDRNVGMVTCLYKISDPLSLGSALESLTIALDFLPSVFVARRLEGVTFGLGASMLIAKQALDRIGGLSSIVEYLADDYQIGNRLWKRGYNIILSRTVVEYISGPVSIPDHIKHQLRWARTNRFSRPVGFFGYGMTYIFPISLVLLIAGAKPLVLAVICSVLLIRISLGLVVYKEVIRSKHWLKWLILIPLKDILSFGIWISSFLGNKTLWRGKTYKILEGGIIREVLDIPKNKAN